MAEIDKLVKHRHPDGGVPPDAPLALAYLEAVTHHIAHHVGDDRHRVEGCLTGWCRMFAPRLPREWIVRAAAEVENPAEEPKLWGADPLAWHLRVTWAERQALDLRTIGAIDKPKPARAKEMKNRKRARDRERAAQERRARGARTAEQVQRDSLSKLRPWACAGMSRSAFYRQPVEVRDEWIAAAQAARDQTANSGTTASPHIFMHSIRGDAVVPPSTAVKKKATNREGTSKPVRTCRMFLEEVERGYQLWFQEDDGQPVAGSLFPTRAEAMKDVEWILNHQRPDRCVWWFDEGRKAA